MKALYNKWFLFFCLLWMMVFSLQKFGIDLPDLLQFYFLDLIAIPVLATLGLAFLKITEANDHIILKKWQLLFIVVATSIAFEIIWPIYNERYTADWVDVLLYTIGGLFFWRKMNK